MAEILVDTDKINIKAIAEQHLQQGAFAQIFRNANANEQCNPVAVKLMCIVDYNVQRLNLYELMRAAYPKLVAQLLQFHSYGMFKYFDYTVGLEIGQRVLQCKFCELIGPYALILTHMSVNHDAHIGSKQCVYCNRTELRKHFGDGTLAECYTNYLERTHIQRDENVCNIVTEFYKMLKNISSDFDISTIRNHGFAGKGHGTVERLSGGYDSDVDDTVTIYKNRSSKSKFKNISRRLIALDQQFSHAMNQLYGSNFKRLFVRPATSPNDTIVISSEDDYDDGGGSATAAANNLAQLHPVSI